MPCFIFFLVAHGAVHDGDVVMKVLTEPSGGLGSQGNFWNEHKCGFSCCDDFFEQFDIDEGFAASGHSVKEKGAVLLFFKCADKLVKSFFLASCLGFWCLRFF